MQPSISIIIIISTPFIIAFERVHISNPPGQEGRQQPSWIQKLLTLDLDVVLKTYAWITCLQSLEQYSLAVQLRPGGTSVLQPGHRGAFLVVHVHLGGIYNPGK